MSVKLEIRTATFKFKVALEAVQGDQTINQIASKYQLNPGQVSQWKRQLQSEGANLFSGQVGGSQRQQAKLEAALYEQIGRLKMGLEWLKKKLTLSVDEKHQLIAPFDEQVSVRRQCELLGLNRASYYYQPATVTPLNLRLMRLIDEQYTSTPLLWLAQNDSLSEAGRRLCHQWETGQTVDAADGTGCHLPPAAD